MNSTQRDALIRICERFEVEFEEEHYHPAIGSPSDWVEGWVGGVEKGRIYVGCSPEGHIHS